MNNNTRRYSRSLAEAFPDERASSGDWPLWFKRRDVTKRVHYAVFWCLLAGLVGMFVWSLV